MKDKKLIKMFEGFCKQNDEDIKSKEGFMPMCITINKDYSINIIAFTFSDQDEKIKMRESLKQLVAVQDIRGYILIQDAKVTKINQETGEREVSDTAMRQLFTPKFAINQFQEYSDGVLGEMTEMTDRKEMNNAWDLWNEVEENENEKKASKEYNKYKQEHPELYKGVYELEDYNKVKSKGELIFAYKIDDGKLKYYQAEKLEKEDKKKLKIAMDSMKKMNDIFKFEFIRVDKDGIVLGSDENA